MMKKRLLLILSAVLLLANLAVANDTFDKNCASCHAGGKNIMNADKDLTKASLDKNGVNTVDKIKKLVSNGKAPMPAFGKQLSQAEIDSVAAYVLEQANKGW
jgi:cytochrome c6